MKAREAFTWGLIWGCALLALTLDFLDSTSPPPQAPVDALLISCSATCGPAGLPHDLHAPECPFAAVVPRPTPEPTKRRSKVL